MTDLFPDGRQFFSSWGKKCSKCGHSIFYVDKIPGSGPHAMGARCGNCDYHTWVPKNSFTQLMITESADENSRN